MATCTKQEKFQCIEILSVNKKPVWFYMTFAKIGVLSSKSMIAIFSSQWQLLSQHVYDFFQRIQF